MVCFLGAHSRLMVVVHILRKLWTHVSYFPVTTEHCSILHEMMSHRLCRMHIFQHRMMLQHPWTVHAWDATLIKQSHHSGTEHVAMSFIGVHNQKLREHNSWAHFRTVESECQQVYTPYRGPLCVPCCLLLSREVRNVYAICRWTRLLHWGAEQSDTSVIWERVSARTHFLDSEITKYKFKHTWMATGL